MKRATSRLLVDFALYLSEAMESAPTSARNVTIPKPAVKLLLLRIDRALAREPRGPAYWTRISEMSPDATVNDPLVSRVAYATARKRRRKGNKP